MSPQEFIATYNGKYKHTYWYAIVHHHFAGQHPKPITEVMFMYWPNREYSKIYDQFYTKIDLTGVSLHGNSIHVSVRVNPMRLSLDPAAHARFDEIQDLIQLQIELRA